MGNFLSSIPLGKNSLTIIGLFVVLVAIPLTVFLAQQQQEIRQRAQSACGRPGNWDAGMTTFPEVTEGQAQEVLNARPDVLTAYKNEQGDPESLAHVIWWWWWGADPDGKALIRRVTDTSPPPGGEIYPPSSPREWFCSNATPPPCTVEWTVPENPVPNTSMEIKIRGISDPEGWRDIRLYLDGRETNNFAGIEDPRPTFIYRNINSGAASPHNLRFAVNRGTKSCTPEKLFTTGGGATPTPGPSSLNVSIKNQLVTSPRNNTRQVEVKILNTQNQEIRSGNASTTFQAGAFKGQLDLGNTFTTGSYVVKLKVRNTLRRLVENITNITAGQINTLREIELFSGDIVEDNELNALDYANLVGCLDRNRGTPKYNCPNPPIADFNDDGAVGGQDLNILVFNFSHRKGD